SRDSIDSEMPERWLSARKVRLRARRSAATRRPSTPSSGGTAARVARRAVSALRAIDELPSARLSSLQAICVSAIILAGVGTRAGAYSREDQDMTRLRIALVAIAVLCAVMAGSARAVTLRWAADTDPGSMDPHSRNVAATLSFLSNIYEGLVRRDRD